MVVEESSWIQWEASDERLPLVEGDVGVLPLVEFHLDRCDEGETAGSYTRSSLSAQSMEFFRRCCGYFGLAWEGVQSRRGRVGKDRCVGRRERDRLFSGLKAS